MTLPNDVEVAARARAASGSRSIHLLKLELAKLVSGVAAPSALNHLFLAERYLAGSASASDLSEARQEAWSEVGSLACYCSPTDAASSKVVLSCLEASDAAHTPSSLLEQLARVLDCGVHAELVLAVLESTPE
jgi:hypothetical protein